MPQTSTVIESYKGSTVINDGTTCISVFDYSYSLPSASVNFIPSNHGRPVLGRKTRDGISIPTMFIWIESSDPDGVRDTLYGLFDPEDDNAYPLVKKRSDGTRTRYIMATVESFEQQPNTNGRGFVVTMKAGKEARWRSVTSTTINWSPSASGQTTSFSVAGTDSALPIIEITPTVLKSAGNTSDTQSFFAVRWNTDSAVTGYPVDIANDAWNTSSIISSGDMQSDGDDIRVYVDSVDSDYWLNDINTTGTKVWVRLNFSAKQEADLSASMGSGSLTSITVSDSISGFPSSGILEIDSELFAYTSKDNSSRTFFGVTRAAHGTTAATHNAGATVHWIQHNITVTYGDSGLSAKSVNSSKAPLFNRNVSSNTVWNFDDFFIAGNNFEEWSFTNQHKTQKYTADQGGTASPADVLGINTDGTDYSDATGYWRIYQPCRISAANFLNGDKQRNHDGSSAFTNGDGTGVESSSNGSSWTQQYAIPNPSGGTGNWEAWSQNVTGLPSNTKYVRLVMNALNRLDAGPSYVEVDDVTLTFNSSYTPTSNISTGVAADTYIMSLTLKNNTTGEDLQVNFQMGVDETLQINTDTRKTTYLLDGSEHLAAEPVGGPRLYLFQLQPGINQLEVEETGLAGMDIRITYEDRYKN